MSVIRKHHNKNYTVMSNYHFIDKELSLKAKGLLSLMLSLPDTWDYSTSGLETLSSDGNTSVRSALKELEEKEYLIRERVYEDGKIVDWAYHIFECKEDCQQFKDVHVENKHVENNNNKILKQSNTKEVNKTNSKELVQNSSPFEFGKQKQPKSNMYANCVSIIDDFTQDTQVRVDLTDYLKLLFEMRKDGFAFYANNWKGLLRKLSRLSKDPKEQHEIICQSIERGYKSFFPVISYSSTKEKPWEAGVSSVAYTDEELAELRKLDAEREAKGMRTRF